MVFWYYIQEATLSTKVRTRMRLDSEIKKIYINLQVCSMYVSLDFYQGLSSIIIDIADILYSSNIRDHSHHIMWCLIP